jgi:hypothetical protein
LGRQIGISFDDDVCAHHLGDEDVDVCWARGNLIGLQRAIVEIYISDAVVVVEQGMSVDGWEVQRCPVGDVVVGVVQMLTSMRGIENE